MTRTTLALLVSLLSACGTTPVDSATEATASDLAPGTIWTGSRDSVLSTVSYICGGQSFRGVMSISQQPAPFGFGPPYYVDGLSEGLSGFHPGGIAARLFCTVPPNTILLQPSPGILFNHDQLNCSVRTTINGVTTTTGVTIVPWNWQYIPASTAEPFGHWDAYINASLGAPGSGVCGNMVLTFRF